MGNQNKTSKTEGDVQKFLDQIEPEQKRLDCLAICKMQQEITGELPKMWGSSIIGFGDYHYKYESGREGDFFIGGFSPRAQNISIYIMAGFERYPEEMEKLGKYKTVKFCLDIKKMTDIDVHVLKSLMTKSVNHINKK